MDDIPPENYRAMLDAGSEDNLKQIPGRNRTFILASCYNTVQAVQWQTKFR